MTQLPITTTFHSKSKPVITSAYLSVQDYYQYCMKMCQCKKIIRAFLHMITYSFLACSVFFIGNLLVPKLPIVTVKVIFLCCPLN